MAPIEFPLDVSGSTPPSSPSFPIVSSALTLLGRYEPRPPPPSERGPKPQAVQVNVVQHLPAKTMTPPPPPPPVQQQPVTLRWAALVGIVLIGMTYAFGYVIHGLARLPGGSSAGLRVYQKDCNWLAETKRTGNPFGCLEFSAWSTVKEEKRAADAGSPGACAGATCGALFEKHRGGDEFVSFDEAVAFDDGARAKALKKAPVCAWPPRLATSDACWGAVPSYDGTRKMAADDACPFVRCRAARGYPSVACLSAVCRSK